MESRLVSIGLPVYNGGEDLRRALDSILAQTHANFELIISDNGSTDELTKALTEDYARRDPRIRLTRQSQNQGMLFNFLWVVEQARGDYFMWAAHDDTWSPNYLERLSRLLDEASDAVLATPRTVIDVTTRSGQPLQKVIPPAPNADRWTTLDLFLTISGVWIYGMFRTDWIKTTAPEFRRYSVLGDHLWLYDLLLTERVVGTDEAVYYRTQTQGKYVLSTRKKFETLLGVLYHIPRLTWTRLPPSERWQGLRRALSFIYRRQIRQRNFLGTSLRIVKLTTLLAWFGIEAGVRRLIGARSQALASRMP